MLVKVAWRNIWRNKLRSVVVITAIATGLLAGLFASAFVNGMMEQRAHTVINTEVSHFQLHHPQFRDKLEAGFFMPEGEELVAAIATNDSVEAVAGRVVAMGSVNSARSTGMLNIRGIDPDAEKAVTGLDGKVVEGTYLPTEWTKRSLPILISRKLADKFQVKLRSKLIFKVMDVNNDIRDGAFKVVGIYDSGNSMYDKANVFVRKEHLRKLLQLNEGALHEIAVLLPTHEWAEPMADRYAATHPELEVLPYLDLALGMRYICLLYTSDAADD